MTVRVAGSANEPNPADEFVTFVQHQVPGLEDGSYELDVSQRITDSDDQEISEEPLERRYRFAVTGDRFSLKNPETTIASTFPASNATGEFKTVLPHVVFNSTTFPWVRTPTTARLTLPPAGQDTEADVPTWLAVLVLDDDDDPSPDRNKLKLVPTIGVLGDLFRSVVYPDTTLGDNYSYFSEAKNMDGLEIDETIGDPVQTIDLPLTLWADLAPTLEDLDLSAHVRTVSIENKPAALGAETPVDPLGTFAIVIGTRLPQDNKKSYAYLVSLEGLEGFLAASNEGGKLRDPSLKMERSLRLAVLAHWTFNTKGGPAAFVDQLEHLNDRTPNGPDAQNTNLRLSVAEAKPPISTALDAGYVPLDHEVRTSEKTVSWYRGPLSPVDQRPTPVKLPISSPDQALVFDPTTGMFDVSLAAAWTIGRLIALQDTSYASALYAWKRGLTVAAVDAVERKLIEEILGGVLASTPALTGTPRLAGGSLLHQTMQLIAAEAQR
jgi:hypothetical protein